MTDAHFCPHCGYNLQADPEIIDGLWRMTPAAISYDGELIDFTPQQAAIVYTLAAAHGRFVGTELLLNRSGDSERRNSIAVQMTRIRAKLSGRAIIQTQWGRGYRWAASPENVVPISGRAA